MQLRRLILFVLLASPCAAQTFGNFGAWQQGPTCSGHPHKQNATLSRVGTTITATVTNGAVFGDNEPIIIKGTGTPLDYTFSQSDINGNAPHIAVGGVSGNTLTITSLSSGTVTATAGTVEPGHPYIATLSGAPGPMPIGPKVCLGYDGDKFMFVESIGLADSTTASISSATMTAKYGGSQCTATDAENGQAATWNYNSYGYASPNFYSYTGAPCTLAKKRMWYQQVNLTNYASTNRDALATQAAKEISYGTTAAWVPANCSSATQRDPFDVYWIQEANAFFTTDAAVKQFGASLYALQIIGDDEQQNGEAVFGATGDLPTGGTNVGINVRGHNGCSMGLLTAIAAPYQGYTGVNPNYNNPAPPYLYPDNVLYAKKLSGSAPGSCVIVGTQCSWPDYARNKYTTVAAMNADWGSNYTTFGSSETVVAAELFGTGNGATTLFNHTTASANVSQFSIQVILTPSGGSAVTIGADCPQIASGCGGSAGTGALKGPPTFIGSQSVPANFVLTDSNGNVQQATSGAPGVVGGSAPAWSTSVGGTTVSGAVTFTMRGTGIASGSCTYSTGVCSITTNNNLQNLATLKINYTSCGWNCGTGLTDESGSLSHAWVPTQFHCLNPTISWQANHAYSISAGQILSDATSGSWQVLVTVGTSGGSVPTFSATAGTNTSDGTAVWQSLGAPVCGTGGDFSAQDGNVNYRKTLLDWSGQLAGQYLRVMNSAIKAAFPDMLFGCIDALGNYDTSPIPQVMTAAQGYCDIGTVQQVLDPSVDANSGARLTYLTQNFSNAIIPYTNYFSTHGSQAPCGVCFPVYTTKAQWGAGWYSLINWSTTTKGFNGQSPFAGMMYWCLIDCQANGGGLKTVNLDNSYDGHEDVSTSVACSIPNAGLPCGNESGAANFLSENGLLCSGGAQCISTANALWFQSTVQTPAPFRWLFAKRVEYGRKFGIPKAPSQRVGQAEAAFRVPRCFPPGLDRVDRKCGRKSCRLDRRFPDDATSSACGATLGGAGISWTHRLLAAI